MNRVLIIGGGGFAKQLYGTLDSSGIEFQFYDETDASKIIDIENYNSLIIAVSGTRVREKIRNRYSLKLKSLISKKADVSPSSKLENGSILLDNTIVEPDVFIGECTIINVGAQIHHDSKIGKYCEIAPAAILLGGCSIGNYTFVGANSTILPNVKIGENVTIGAGSVVTKDVSNGKVVKGVPAK